MLLAELPDDLGTFEHANRRVCFKDHIPADFIYNRIMDGITPWFQPLNQNLGRIDSEARFRVVALKGAGIP